MSERDGIIAQVKSSKKHVCNRETMLITKVLLIAQVADMYDFFFFVRYSFVYCLGSNFHVKEVYLCLCTYIYLLSLTYILYVLCLTGRSLY